MGLLSGIGNLAKNIVKTVVPPFEAVVQHPIQSIKTIGNGAAFNKLAQDTVSKPLTTQIGNILLSTGTVAAAVVGGGAALGSTTARTIGTSVVSAAAKLIPSSTKGKVAAAVVAPVVASAVISNPGGAIKTVSNTVKAQVDLGKTIANPSLASAEQFIKEHPGASIAIGAGTVAAVGGGLGLAANTAATYLNSRATNANTEATTTPEPTSAILPTAAAAPTESKRVAEIPASNNLAPVSQQPQTPQTQTISNTTVRRKKHIRKLKIAPISQKVNVIVSNRAVGTKVSYANKYLNREVYA